MWEAIRYVGSVITLIAFIVAIVAWLYKQKLDSEVKRISLTPEGERAVLVQQTLESRNVGTTGLTREQRYKLALEQYAERAQRFKSLALLCFFAMLLSATLTFFSIRERRPVVAERAECVPHRAKTLSALSVTIDSLTVLIRGVDAAQPTAMVTFDWGDGNVTRGAFPQSHTYVSEGVYTVSATASYCADVTDKTQTRVVVPARLPGAAAEKSSGPTAAGASRVTNSRPQLTLSFSHEQLWEALVQNDVNSVAQLVESGMKLKPEYLDSYFREHFSPETYAVLNRNGALPSAACPVRGNALSLYADARNDNKKAGALRVTCGSAAHIAAVRREELRVMQQIEGAQRERESFAESVGVCVTEMRKTSTETWYEQAARFDFLEPVTYTLRESIKAKLTTALLSNQVTEANKKEVLDDAIGEMCRQHNQPDTPENTRLLMIRSALAVLTNA